MNYKSKKCSYSIIITTSFICSSHVIPMHRALAKTAFSGTLIGGTAKYVYDKKRNIETLHQRTQLIVLFPTSATQPLQCPAAPSQLSLSPTYNHIIALHKATWPTSDKSTFEQQYQDIVTHYYPNGLWQLPDKTKNELCVATKYLIEKEIASSDDSYTVYHGTKNVLGIVLRTRLAHDINPTAHHKSFALRDPGTENIFKNIDTTKPIAQHLIHVKENEKKRLRQYCSDERSAYTGQLFGTSPSASENRMQVKIAEFPQEYKDALLAVNAAALANSSPAELKGSNSLRFIAGIQDYNNWWSFLIPDNKSAIAEADITEIKRTIEDYGANPDIIDKYSDDLRTLSANTDGMLIQMMIPKDQAHLLTLCKSFNFPIRSAHEKLASLQKLFTQTTVSDIDHGHMVMPLPLFDHTTKMRAIVRTDEKTMSKLTEIFEKISAEVKNEIKEKS